MPPTFTPDYYPCYYDLCRGINMRRYTGLIVDRRGERNPCARLTEEDVRGIMRLYAQGTLTQAQIAALYDISQGMVSKIINGQKWPHITRALP